MIRNFSKWQAFEKKLIRKEKKSFEENLKVFEEMYKQALF